jgi:hypothetical protein
LNTATVPDLSHDVFVRRIGKAARHLQGACLRAQFDGVLHFDRTRAVEPLERAAALEAGDVQEMFRTGI